MTPTPRADALVGTMDEELIPEILPVEARLVVAGPVKSFQEIVSRALRVVPPKEIIPGTSQILLEAVKKPGTLEYLRASATDGTITVSSASDDIEIRLSGAVLIPGQKVLSILKMAPTDFVSLQVIGNQLLLRSGNSQWRVHLVPGESLPTMPAVGKLEPVEVEIRPFLWALKAAESAASRHSARSSLMQVEVVKGRITGTDGNRLHRAFFASEDHPLEVNIPMLVVPELIKMLESTEDSHFYAAADDRHMAFTIDRDYVVSSALVTNFPDMMPLLVRASMNVKHTLDVDRMSLSRAVARVRVNADQDFSALFLGIVKNREGIWGLSVRTQDRFGNSAHEFIEAKWSGPQEQREFCINHKNLSSLLDVYDGLRVVFKVGDDTQSSKSPLLVEDDGKFVGLIQQMRSDFLD